MRSLLEQDHYEILELPRGATREQVERAYRMARVTFADDSLALYSVVDPGDAEAIRERVEEAFRVLTDPEARAAYDAGLGPEAEGAAAHVAFEDPDGGAAADGPALRAEVPPERYDGATFRDARLRRSLDLDHVAGITKVNPRYLRYIEEENLEGLPAPVYVRGFVRAYAQVVGLDPTEAARGFLSLLEEAPPEPRRARLLGRR